MHQALLEGGYLTEPDVPSGFLETSLGVDRHLFKARALSRVHAQEAASRARAFVHARRRVRPVTVAERDLAQQEVLLEVAPLRLRRLSELAPGSRAPTPFDEGLVRLNDFFRARFSSGKDVTYVPLRPERVLEVRYDQLEGDPAFRMRFRHTVQFERWRPDREATSCRFDQLDVPAKYDLGDVID